VKALQGDALAGAGANAVEINVGNRQRLATASSKEVAKERE
jgi:hypothetical protein